MKRVTIDVSSPHEIDASCGTKATTLVALKNLGLSIPKFYAVSSSCFESFCEEVGIKDTEIFYASSEFDSEIIKKFEHTDLLNKDGVIQKIEDGKYMVRSSSIPTKYVDLKMFPSMISGAFESYFAPTVSEVASNIPKVWRSVFSEKAYNQCRIFSKSPIIKGIGVLIQRYVEPIISGLAHTQNDMVSANWVEGHLSKIVSGEELGNSIDVYLSTEHNYILRGIENNILLVKNNNYENVFKSLWDSAVTIRKHFGCDQEIEWVYDGATVWIVQSQSLIINNHLQKIGE